MKDIMNKNIKLTQINYFWSFTKILLKVVAIWPVTKNNLTHKKYIDSIHFFSVSFSALLQFILMGIMCLKLTDFNSAAESIGPMMQLIISFGKLCIYRSHKKNLAKLSIKLEYCLENLDKNSITNIYFKSYMKLASFICFGFYGIAIFLSIGYLAGPLLEENRTLPFNVYYPWDWKHSRIFYAISYVHEIIITVVLGCTSASEFSYVWCILYCCARFKEIHQKLVSIPNDNNNKNTQKFLSSIVKFHEDVLW
ncbi:uncharacterized protein LOC122860669 [Aphidius gifuensis]|uniref:uncharacterized protein LOC122860669 n=1 Tax=Aphidius gifuensis TaxID=684658 RepID=UPI001CDD17E5|nr:uncharacterized protein LOC122860669 [Aphidius gifuensis]